MLDLWREYLRDPVLIAGGPLFFLAWLWTALQVQHLRPSKMQAVLWGLCIVPVVVLAYPEVGWISGPVIFPLVLLATSFLKKQEEAALMTLEPVSNG